MKVVRRRVGRARARARRRARPHRRGRGHARQPGIPGSVGRRPPDELDADLFVIGPEAPLVDGLADRLRAAGQAGVRPGRRRRPARGLEGVDEGGARRGRRAHRPPRRLHRGRSRRSRSSTRCPASTSSRPTGWPRARACSSPSRSTEAERRRAGQAVGRGVRRRRPHGRDRGGPDRARAVGARACATARGPCRWRRRRTSSGSATATPGPTPAAWAPTRRCRSPAPTSSTQVMDRGRRADARRAARAGASTTAACSTPGSCSRPTGRRCSSTTSASATPRPRWCCPGSTSDLAALLAEAAAGELAHRARVRATTPRSPWCCAAEGYPATPRTGDVIDGLDDAEAIDGRHRLLRRRRRRTPTARWSPPAAGCSTSPASAPTSPRPARRAYDGGRPASRWPGHAVPHRHRRGHGRAR